MCKHEQFSAAVDINRFEDSGRFLADARISCLECKMPFHFVGIAEFGLVQSAPSLNANGTEAHLPIAPGPLPIPGEMSYQYPKELIRLKRIEDAAFNVSKLWDSQNSQLEDAIAYLKKVLVME